jgi:hypothetical protein
MAGIFINYRRDDVRGVAGRLYDHLTTTFSKDEVFMDVDAMKPGMDFVRQLDNSVSQCHVFLAMIGPNWLEAKDHSGRRRLDDSKDFVRVELASALKREIPVIPVLIDGAEMPPEERLPDDLKPLARRHALELRHTRVNSDAATIANVLEKIAPPERHVPWRLIGAGAAMAAVVVAVVVLALLLSGKWRSSPAVPSLASVQAPSNVAVARPSPLPSSSVATPSRMPPPAVAKTNADVAATTAMPPPPPPGPAIVTITGVWNGTYFYPSAQKPVPFIFSFDANGCAGRSEEPNTFGNKSAAKLYANLSCSVGALSPGQTITITKTYDGTGGVSHTVMYTGTVSADLNQISGQWAIGGKPGGAFLMQR